MPAEALEKILEQDLGGLRKSRSIRFKEDNSAWEFPQFIRDIPWINFFQEAGAQALRVFLILLFAALALAAVIHSRRSGRPLLFNRPSSVSLPSPPEPLSPAALLAEADRLYRGGFLREAWGRCYAASLEALRLRWALRFPPGATEYRCLALVRLWAGRGAADGGRAEAAFAGLIRHWTALFYGGINPPAGAFEEAAAWAGSLADFDEIPAPENKAASGGGARG
jgi:hypothetical protein